MPKIENGRNATTMLGALDHAKAVKMQEINDGYERAIAALTPTYPDTERLTFDKQESEARALEANADAETPLLTALAAGRHIDKTELARRVIAKADAFAVASGYLTGQRQRMEDLLDKAQSLADVQNIVVTYSLSVQDDAE